MELIEEMRGRKVFGKTEYYSRLKKDVRKLCNLPDVTQANELIKELDSRVIRTAINYN